MSSKLCEIFIFPVVRSAVVEHSNADVCSECKRFNGECTHSSLVRSCVSFTRSLKHPSEYMLSKTSGSSSVRDRILFRHTRRGGGCSGQGSLRPPLMEKRISLSATFALKTAKQRAVQDTERGSFKFKICRCRYLHRAGENGNTYWYHGCFCISSSCKRQKQKMASLRNKITAVKMVLLANLSNLCVLKPNLLVFLHVSVYFY